MTIDDRFEQLLADVLADAAPTREPDRLVPESLRAARREHRRPRWLALIKEPPMRISSRVAVGSPTFRLASIMALTLALVLALGAAVAVGASMLPNPGPRLPEPYGPAANGLLLFSQGGDIFTANPDGGNPTAIIKGSDLDQYPSYSHDGTKIMFGRGPDNDLALMLANADGSDVHQVMSAVQWADFMPSDQQIVGSRTVDGHTVISLVDVDGKNLHDLDIGALDPMYWVEPRPTDGQELIFLAHPTADSTDRAFYGIGVDGANLRQIGDIRTGESQVDPLQISLQDPVLSSDGKTMAYWSWEAKPGKAPDSYVHVRDLTTGGDQLLDLYPFYDAGYGPHFSPDGSQLLYEAHSASEPGNDQLVIAPVDGSRPATPMGPSYYYQSRQGFDFSPDGAKVFLSTTSGTSFIDVASDTTVETPASIPTVPGWQRLAP